ncbi:MAG: phosphoglycerate mutase family protein [Bacteroidales bacterium]|jgi:broad specificity phosphatase PhoE|nr:phosphoglycerate mutase family protein [Bacteroidales bacterium]
MEKKNIEQKKQNDTFVEVKKKDKIESKSIKNIGHKREHAEFHNSYRVKDVKNDVKFLNNIYGDKISISTDDVTKDFVNKLKVIGKDIYFFLLSLEDDMSPQFYIKYKHEFIQNNIPDGDKNLFFLAWNGLIKNDSFRRLLLKTFSLSKFSDVLAAKNIPAIGASFTRYRSKFVLAEEDMEVNEGGKMRTVGRQLDDGSGLVMREGIVWLPNGKGIPIFPQAYVPLNQTQIIVIRHGKSEHESGGGNPEFVGSGYWDLWEKNKRISCSIGNNLKPEGIDTARELGRDFNVIVDLLGKNGLPLWMFSKERPIQVFGSESENTEQTARYFLQEAGYTNVRFDAVYGLNSQKYGALTHKYKKDINKKMLEIYGDNFEGNEDDKKKEIKSMLKNRFFHYPEGESLIEADWRIASSFVELVKSNLGKRVLLADHSGALRVFEAVIRTLDFADYATIKEGQDSIMALVYEPGKNMRYDYLQKKGFYLRNKKKK